MVNWRDNSVTIRARQGSQHMERQVDDIMAIESPDRPTTRGGGVASRSTRVA